MAFTLVLSLVLACVVSAHAQTCQKYDLSPLKKSSSTNYGPYSFKTGGDITYSYYWNFCAPVHIPGDGVCGTIPSVELPVSIQVLEGSATCIPIGRLNESSFSADSNGVVLEYENPIDTCKSGTINRVTSFQITCDPSTEWKTTNVTEDANIPCQYNIMGRSKYACPVKPTCAWTDGQHQYDLSPLTKSHGQAYSFKVTTSSVDYTLYWNFCEAVALPKDGCGTLSSDNPATAYQVYDRSGCMPIGRLANSNVSSNAKGTVSVTYVNPVEKCASGTIDRVTQFMITCDATSEWTTVSVTENSLCTYTIVGRSKYACPANRIGQQHGSKSIHVV